ncbi:penicillin acylase family protein [Formosa sediminum]|uniref:penicillin acylase family protein n=1 Tax=Formosa sediminum TaxID=2594004 RepID=UPI001C8F7E19|nr:penicillin acylase family protein [Formosa sediminum]
MTLTIGCSKEEKLSQVEIKWTKNEVPHIKANNYKNLGYGYGYVHAKDRICEISGQAITLRGERSLRYGADAIATIGFLKTTNLNSDLLFKIRIPEEWVQEEFEKLNKETKDYIKGYVDGINYYVSTLTEEERNELCEEGPVITFKTSDVIRSAMRFGVQKELIDIGPHIISSSQAWQKKTTNYALNSPHTKAVEIEGGFGSNGWVYGSDVTKTKSSIMLSNPHSAWKRTVHQQRIYMHQYHLTIPGELDVAGASFLGIPFPMTGYNADVAWTILDAATVTPYVLQSMEVEESAVAPKYLMDGQQKPLKIKSVPVRVLEKDKKIKTHVFKFVESELGILYKLPEKKGKPAGWYAITNPGEKNAKGLDQFLAIAHSKSTRDFISAVENNRGILSQLLVADKFGEVGYVIAGQIPPITDDEMEKYHINNSTAAFNVINGTTSDASFRDSNNRPLLAPASFYPNIISKGIIHNTNNSYKYTEYGNPQKDYPSVFGQHKPDKAIGKKKAAGLRYDPRLIMSAQRMNEITKDSIVTPKEALEVLFDNRNYAAETFLDRILELNNESISEDAKNGFRVLSTWDRKNNSKSKGALLFHQFWKKIIKMGVLLSSKNDDPEIGSQINITPQNSPAIINALEEAVHELANFGFQPDDPWGEALYTTVNETRIPLHGGSYQEGLLNGEMPAPLTSKGFPYILFGTAYVQLIDWNDGNLNANVLLSHGQSNSIDYKGHLDQLKMFSNKKLYKVPFTQKDLNTTKVIDSLILTVDHVK